MRSSRSFEGDRDRGRWGDGGGFLRSICTMVEDEDEGKSGTDCALPLPAGALPLELGFVVLGVLEPEPEVVPERILDDFFPCSGCERLRVCAARGANVMGFLLLLSLTLVVSPSSSRFSRLSSRPSEGESGREVYWSSSGGETERLVVRAVGGTFPGDKSSSSSVSSVLSTRMSVKGSAWVWLLFLSAVRASFNGDPWDN